VVSVSVDFGFSDGALLWSFSAMPTLMKKFDNQWQGRVYANGKQVASKLFPKGKKGGPEWRAAKQWEEEEKQKHLAGVTILSDFERLLQWGELFLEHTARTTSPKDLNEKSGPGQQRHCGVEHNGPTAS